MSYYKVIGNNLKKLREMKGLKQIDLAVILNIKQPYYSQLENANKEISIDQLAKIADEFNIEFDWFLGRNPAADKRIKNETIVK